MLAFDTTLVAIPAVAAGLALLGYAGLLWQKRKAEQQKPKLRPIPVTSRKRRDKQG
jgi:hypothetical protein